MFQRAQVEVLRRRMRELDNPLLQVLVGPRQTGKSTMLSQALEGIGIPYLAVSVDDALVANREWLETQWQQARNLIPAGAATLATAVESSAKGSVGTGAKSAEASSAYLENSDRGALLIVDEIQKIPSWSRAVKALWDQDRASNIPLKVFLSGSSTLLLTAGLEESLLGRFELIRSTHWSLAECRAAFGFDLDDYLFFGGFPGAARLVGEEKRWRDYVRNAIIEPTISLDALQIGDIRKPALLRALFTLDAGFSAQELSYTKMLGQLHDAGNTTTLAGYLDILGKVGMITGLQKYHPSVLTARKSSPRLLVYDTGLMSAVQSRSQQAVLADHEARGHLVESAVGARLLAECQVAGLELFWWREGNQEVDYVLRQDERVVAIEVKSGRQKPGGSLDAFLRKYPQARRLVVGGAGHGAVSLEDFLMDSAAVLQNLGLRL